MFDKLLAEATTLRYRTLLLRTGAAMVDTLVFVPLVLAARWGAGHASAPALAALEVVLVAIPIVYRVALHARYGKTLGKMAVGVKVLDEGEGPITLRQAALRDAPIIVLQVLMMAADLGTIAAGGNPIAADAPTPAPPALSMIFLVWCLADGMAAVIDPKRRSLHDRIAGTVVVRG